MWKGIVFCCLALTLVAGCAEVPRPTTFPVPHQQHVQSASHWQSLAQLTVGRLSDNLHLRDFVEEGKKTPYPSIYVQAKDKTPFDKAFRQYLITELITAGFKISESLDTPNRIYWDIQLVSRDKDRWNLGPFGFGVPAAVAEGLAWFFTGNRWTTNGIVTPNQELILTTRFTVGEDKPQNIINKGIYSDTFYINSEDLNNYLYYSTIHPKSIAAKDEDWKRRLDQKGLLSHSYQPQHAVAKKAEPAPVRELPPKKDRN